ncbi:hypothetical protein GCM10023307_14440 [Lysobacter hankyongensis]|uniref:Uncharacterized protein n=1 Tax=Lysobacter hankyongensis TaxID=1176535 RepID=A0ABP9B685_9GAMM
MAGRPVEAAQSGQYKGCDGPDSSPDAPKAARSGSRAGIVGPPAAIFSTEVGFGFAPARGTLGLP